MIDPRDFAERGEQIERLLRQNAALVKALEEIRDMGTDCAAADDPESFLRSQLRRAIGVATRALDAYHGEGKT